MVNSSFIYTFLYEERCSKSKFCVKEINTGLCWIKIKLGISLENIICLLFHAKNFIRWINSIIWSGREIFIWPRWSIWIPITIVLTFQEILISNSIKFTLYGKSYYNSFYVYLVVDLSFRWLHIWDRHFGLMRLNQQRFS